MICVCRETLCWRSPSHHICWLHWSSHSLSSSPTLFLPTASLIFTSPSILLISPASSCLSQSPSPEFKPLLLCMVYSYVRTVYSTLDKSHEKWIDSYLMVYRSQYINNAPWLVYWMSIATAATGEAPVEEGYRRRPNSIGQPKKVTETPTGSNVCMHHSLHGTHFVWKIERR